MQHLQDQQQEVEEPPGRVGPDDGPALKHGGVQHPGKEEEDQVGLHGGDDAPSAPASAPPLVPTTCLRRIRLQLSRSFLHSLHLLLMFLATVPTWGFRLWLAAFLKHHFYGKRSHINETELKLCSVFLQPLDLIEGSADDKTAPPALAGEWPLTSCRQ